MALLPALRAPAQSHSGRRPRRRIGVLYWGPESYSSNYFAPHFLNALAELGHSVGSSLEIEWRYSDGDTARDAQLIEELRRARVDAIVTAGSERTQMVSTAFPGLPIVAHLEDPVARGHARSLAAPGGRVTGLTVEVARTATKQFELLRRLQPRCEYVGILIDALTQTPESRGVPLVRAANSAGLAADWKVVDGVSGFAAAFAALERHEVRAAFILNWRAATDIRAVSELAKAQRVATMSLYRPAVDNGLLMAYFANTVEVGRRLAGLLDKVVRGTPAGAIPFEQPSRFSLVINRSTAQAIGIRIPPSVLLEAEEVIG